MIRGRATGKVVVVAVIWGVFGGQSTGLAQDAEAPVDEASAEEAPTDPTDVTEEGVPTEAVEASEGVAEVEKAMEQVEKETEEGLPAEFVIKFGDVHDWLRLTSGEWLKGKLKRLREE
ncbi:MAG: hypothetical protein DRH23_09655 [Deltaproteobacteria bacterium]|nr:MAG: hypothetical protein DRH23_09655 [Deltaproteobacteria bacterium]